MASPYIIPAPKVRKRRRRGRIGAATVPGIDVPPPPEGQPRPHVTGMSPQTVSDEGDVARTSSGIPIGAAIAVLIGVMVLSKGR